MSNYNPNDLYIILSSIKSGDNGYTLDNLKNYALATNSADAFINLLELDELGKYYGVAVQEAVDKIIAEKQRQKAEENAGVDPELLAYINERIEARKNAKKEKNFAEADAIRDELLAKGITILDTREGTKFTINQ